MTKLVHADPAVSDQHCAPATGPGVFQDGAPSDVPLTAAARAASLNDGTSWLDDALSIEDLTFLTTRHLRVLSNHLFRLLDTGCPPLETVERYEAVIAELDERTQHVMKRAPRQQLKETFRDNSLYCRFELYVDGTLAVYLKYTMNGAQMNLIHGVEQPPFQGQGLDTTLMRHVLLNAHKRRLSILPHCPMASAFLANNPHYRSLAPQPRM